jgi:energy-coupling factor transporter ATP-binding protein EcfA2
MEEDVRETLKKLDIHTPSLRVIIDRLSGGQRQAVAIAKGAPLESEARDSR